MAVRLFLRRLYGSVFGRLHGWHMVKDGGFLSRIEVNELPSNGIDDGDEDGLIGILLAGWWVLGQIGFAACSSFSVAYF